MKRKENSPETPPIRVNVETEPQLPSAPDPVITAAVANPKTMDEISLEDAERYLAMAEQSPDYINYQKQRINFETLDSLLGDFDAQVDVSKKNAAETREHLNKMITDIKRGASDYYRIILKTEQLKSQKYEIQDEREFINRLYEHGIIRQRIHEALISKLSGLTRFCNVKLKELGVVIPQEKLFKSEELRDRHFVAHWAFHTEKGGLYASFVERLKEKLKQKGRVRKGTRP
jgi:archaellum component FlaC